MEFETNLIKISRANYTKLFNKKRSFGFDLSQYQSKIIENLQITKSKVSV